MQCPMPQEWIQNGQAPSEAVAAYSEGMCPVHVKVLDLGMFRVGGKGSGWYATVHWISGGWCDWCRAWWCRPFGRGAELVSSGGLAVQWDSRR